MIISGSVRVKISWSTFPAGERNVKVKIDEDSLSALSDRFTIKCKFEGSDDLIDMLLLVDAIRSINKDIKLKLQIPYFPYARQDRIMTNGEALSLRVIVDLIKSCNFETVETFDPHSDVLCGMFPPGILKVVEQADLAKDQLMYNPEVLYGDCALVSPDAGALKKIYKLGKLMNMPVIVASKIRDVKTGEISGTKVDLTTDEASKYGTLIVVDDICDGGRTFIELGKEIRKVFQGKLVLYVTHGIFSKGIGVLDEIYDAVLYSNDMRKTK